MERIISLSSGGTKPNAYENDRKIVTFQGMKSLDAFGPVEKMEIMET